MYIRKINISLGSLYCLLLFFTVYSMGSKNISQCHRKRNNLEKSPIIPNNNYNNKIISSSINNSFDFNNSLNHSIASITVEDEDGSEALLNKHNTPILQPLITDTNITSTIVQSSAVNQFITAPNTPLTIPQASVDNNSFKNQFKYFCSHYLTNSFSSIYKLFVLWTEADNFYSAYKNYGADEHLVIPSSTGGLLGFIVYGIKYLIKKIYPKQTKEK